MADFLRKNIGIIISSIGLILLVILTYGDLGELFTDNYWKNVGGNLTSISALTIGLVLVQVAIKQGISEQALSHGLNTENTKAKYLLHKEIKNKCKEKLIYLPYFLTLRNERETLRRKQEFLVENNFTSERGLRASGSKKLIQIYEKIRTNITLDSINWSTTEIVYNKNGRIEKLEAYRRKRTFKAIISGFTLMLSTTLIAGGLFLHTNQIPWWQKTIKLFTYLITMVISVIFDVGKNYEKGAFGVPNELEEINSIWEEFLMWQVPDEIKKEVENECFGRTYGDLEMSLAGRKSEEKINEVKENLEGVKNELEQDSLSENEIKSLNVNKEVEN